MLLRIVTMWVPLPKDILGASSQRPTGCLFPKIYWVPLPKDLLGASSQRPTGCGGGDVGGGGVIATAVSRGDGGDGG
ncbi:hypothetical protein Tco_0298551 [Tanacetum coccineum]